MPAQKALVVDDNYYNRDLCRLALEHNGIEVSEAQNGYEALAALQKDSYALLLLDLAMPELDGLEVLKEMQQLHLPTRPITIIITAFGHMAATYEIASEADYILHKPIDIAAFVDLVRRITRPA